MTLRTLLRVICLIWTVVLKDVVKLSKIKIKTLIQHWDCTEYISFTTLITLVLMYWLVLWWKEVIWCGNDMLDFHTYTTLEHRKGKPLRNCWYRLMKFLLINGINILVGYKLPFTFGSGGLKKATSRERARYKVQMPDVYNSLYGRIECKIQHTQKTINFRFERFKSNKTPVCRPRITLKLFVYQGVKIGNSNQSLLPERSERISLWIGIRQNVN